MKRKLSILFFAIFCLSFASTLDVQTALKQASEQFSQSLKEKSIVAILGIYSESSEFSEFMSDELTANFVRIKKLKIVDRANLDAIRKEMNFQFSGEVGDESIQQLGAKLEAETVIIGTLKLFGKSSYRLAMRALNVTTAEVRDMYSEMVEPNRTEVKWLSDAEKAQKPTTRYSATSLGWQNLFFGLGSYRAGHPGDGAVLTIGHLSGLACIIVGTGMYISTQTKVSNADVSSNTINSHSNLNVSSPPPPPDPNMPPEFQQEWEYHQQQEQFYQEQQQKQEQQQLIKEKKQHKREQIKQKKISIALLATGGILELGSIIYGFVAPKYYQETKSIANFFNPKEDGFHVALGTAGQEKKNPMDFSSGITLSYRINY